MSELGDFVFKLLNDIEEASNKNENFDLHMEASQVKEIAELYKSSSWIEIL